MTSENKPLRRDATGRMIRDWDKPKLGKVKDCADFEVVYANVEAALYILKQQLSRINEHKKSIEERISVTYQEMQELQKTRKKEFSDKVVAKSIGAVTGGTIGGMLGASGGLGGTMLVGQLGMGVGTNFGRLAEELGDALRQDSETDFTLKIKAASLQNRLEALSKQHEILMHELNHKILPEIKKSEKEVQKAKENLMSCRRH